MITDDLGRDFDNLLRDYHAVAERFASCEKRAIEAEAEAKAATAIASKVIEERDEARAALATVAERLNLIEKECENSLTGQLAGHFYLANIHAMSRSTITDAGRKIISEGHGE